MKKRTQTKDRNRTRALGRVWLLGWGVMVLVGLSLAGCATAPGPATTAREIVWPAAPESPRVRYLGSIDDQSISAVWGDVVSSWVDQLLGEKKGGGAKMGKPYGIAVDPQGRVYVADPGVSAVWVWDPQAQEKKDRVRLVGNSGQGMLRQPTGVAVSDDGTIFVSDVMLDRVHAFDLQGNLKLAIGQKDDFINPAGLAIDQKGKRLYVADAGHHAIHVLDFSGKRLKVIGYRGKGPGEFNYPTNIFVRGDRLYVTDTMNFRIQILDLEGNFIHTFGEIGDSLGKFARPKGIAVDSEGHIYVVDAAFDNFQIFDEKGRLLLFVGHGGYEAGEFTLPSGMFIDERDRLYVADSYNRRVQIFQFLSDRYKEQGEREATQKK